MIDERKVPPPVYIELEKRLKILGEAHDDIEARTKALEQWQEHINNGDAMDLMNLQRTDNDLIDRVKALEELMRKVTEWGVTQEKFRQRVAERVQALEDRRKEEKV